MTAEQIVRLLQEANIDYSIHAPEGTERLGYVAAYLTDAGVTLDGARCEGHAELPDESYDRLRDRYDENPVGFVAELAKHNAERKIMHAILTRAGVPSETAQGRALCLVARLAILAER